MEPIRVLIVDGQARARQSLKAFLCTCPWIREVKTAAEGKQALVMIPEIKPDVIIMDLRMPERTGLETLGLLKATYPQTKIIALSLYSQYALQALAAGADEFVSKGDSAASLLTTIKTVVNRK